MQQNALDGGMDCALLGQIAAPLLIWYDASHRILPWRENPEPYRVWVSEIMLQQTRVEAVKPYFDRFLEALPNCSALASAKEEVLLKLWEGLGYYNRVRNMQKAAIRIQEEYAGQMPEEAEELMKLPGIGSYTAGAISSIAFGKKNPAVDGNVLRVLSRVCADGRNILDAKLKREVEVNLKETMSEQRPGDFNQAMMELGAMVCLPNGMPKCQECPLREICLAKKADHVLDYPIKVKKKPRKTEEKTILVLQDENKAALVKRPSKGLLAGMYEFPSMDGHCTKEEVIEYLKHLGYRAVRIIELEDSRHIFSHREWQMKGYAIRVDELDQAGVRAPFIFVEPKETQEKYAIPSAFAAYTKYLNIRLGNDRFVEE